MTAIQAIPIELIRLDGGTQIRACKTQQTKIDEYATAMGEGAQFPPLVVFFDGESYWLADGFHRLGAYNVVMQALELPGLDIECEVIEGTQRKAILYACGTNAIHGLPRTNTDKHTAVETLLKNPLVSRDENGVPWSDRAIGRICKVDGKTVARIRAEIADAEIRNSISYEKGGTTVTRVRGGVTQGETITGYGAQPEAPRIDEQGAAQPDPDEFVEPEPDEDEPLFEPDPTPEDDDPDEEEPVAPAPEAPAKTAEVVQFTSPHDYLYDLLAEIDRAMAKLPEPYAAASEFPATLSHALPLERVVEIKHWWLDFTRFWAARDPEFQRHQQRQRDFIKEELNVHTH
jgi:hypothetical protein